MLLGPDVLNRDVQRSSSRLFELIRLSLTLRDTEKDTGTPKTTVYEKLNRSGLVAKRPHTVPHGLTAAEQNTHVKVCSSLLSLYRTTSWTEKIVVMDEKWITYRNPDSKLQGLPQDIDPQPVPEGDIHSKKHLLSLYYCSKGVVYYQGPYSSTTKPVGMRGIRGRDKIRVR
ncbi:unnamed protein product [Heligmosomoides polygyrus]|uniref:Mariner Mos1 transposase n=1 Tax=Heligmosomoides polygyrus TaxID=6339 RepID=A0A183GGN8_HELPZ|nr:unnamed protein product [Heligmosomoides polygyrus]